VNPDFRAQLKERLNPLLRGVGFFGSGTTFRRLSDDVIRLVHVQGSRYGGSCCVNLAMHLTFLPTVLGDPTDPKKITEPLCEFRKRLAPDGRSDHWWDYGATEQEAAASVESLVDLFRRVALPHFERFRTFPGPFAGITPQVIISGDFRLLPGNMTAARAALVMARISAHLGQQGQAREFAEVGLASLGPTATMGASVARDLATIAKESAGIA
jgi:hypothetical protein